MSFNNYSTQEVGCDVPCLTMQGLLSSDQSTMSCIISVFSNLEEPLTLHTQHTNLGNTMM